VPRRSCGAPTLALEQFAYSASHDLQEPLRTIKIYSELLATQYAAEGAALECLGFLGTAASRIESLVKDLLAYMTVTQVEKPIETVDANDALSSALANLGAAITESSAEITYDPLPAVRVHGVHLQQLFQNLVANSIKYRAPERRPVVHVTAKEQHGMWLFSVSDNGIGIAAKFKEQIFGLFTRLHSGELYTGTGIGLAICQRIVERYDGRIWVESEPGIGSSYWVTFPRCGHVFLLHPRLTTPVKVRSETFSSQRIAAPT